MQPRPPPAWTEALVFFAVLLVLAVPDLFAQSADRALGLAWSEVFTMLLPALVAAAGSNLRPAAFLGLGRPRPAPVALGALLGALGFLAANGVMALWVMVLPAQVLKAFPDVGRLFEAGPLTRAALVAVAGILAPLCEEAAFRGWLQRGLLRAIGPAPAIAVAALLFAVRHLDPVRFPALVLLGALFGWLSWRSGSLWPAIAAHAANNAAALAVALWRPADATSALPTLTESLLVLLVGGAAMAGLAVAFRRVVPAPSAPPPLPLRDPGDPSTRFMLVRVPDALAAVVALGLVTLLALLIRSAR